MEITTSVPARVRWVLVSACLALSIGAPGCSFTTHFDDFQAGDGDDAGLDSGPREDAGDAGDDRDSNVDSGVPTHAVHVELTGAGAGAVTAMPGDFTCDSDCTWQVPDGTMLAIHAAPDALSTLEAWGAACDATDLTADCMLTVESDLEVSAAFVVREVELTVTVSNPPGVVTATEPAELTIACDGTPSGTCAGTVAAGTVVTLSAAPSAPNTQVAWAGVDCTGTTCTFTMTTDLEVTATFSDGRPVLGVTITGEGSVVADDSRINCNAGSGDCSEIYDPATSTTLRATASVGNTFTGWEGCDSMVDDACTVTLTESRNVTAHFTQNTYDLTVIVTGTAAGMVTSTSPSLTCTAADGTCVLHDVPHGATISLLATPVAGARFSSWGGVSGCATGTTCGFVITGETSATATFVPDTRTVQIAFSGGAGQVFADSAPLDCSVATTGGMPGGTCSATLNVGSSFNLTVIPAAGSTFTGWSSAPVGIGCTGSATTCMASVVTAIPGSGGTITAMFTPQRFNLTVVAQAATGGGSVSISPGPTMPTCTASVAGTSCVNNYAFGSTVLLHGAQNAGSVFLGWSGGVCSGTADCTVTMDMAKSVTGTFALMTDQLQVNTSGPTTGTVTSTTPSGAINCGADCNETVPSGTMVTLMATPAMNYQFVGWSGVCSGSSPTCTVTVSGTTIVTATFAPVQRTLMVVRAGTGAGTVTDDAMYAQISCGSDCTGDYDHGTMVTLTANATVGSVFSGWSSGPCSGSSSTCIVAMTSARSVTATFSPATAVLNVLPSGTGSGLVTSAEGMIDCAQPASGTSSCSGTYTTPTTVVLTARPGSDSIVAAWSGCDSVSADSSTCTVSLTATRSVAVVFDRRRHAISVSISPSGSGSVTSGDGLINCGAVCNATYDEGSTVRLTASASGTNVFAGWNGVPGCGTNVVCIFTVTGPVSPVATFTPSRTLTLRVTGSATTAGSRVLSAAGPSVSCTAPTTGTATCTYTAPSGTQFFLRGDGQPDYVGPIWSGGPTCSGSDCAFTLNADTTINVSFAPLGNLFFVSSMTHNGMFASTASAALTAANTFCQTQATAASLPGTYIAWISTSTTSMSSRIPSGDSRWVRVDGRPIATSRAQLFSGALTHPVMETETGAYASTASVLTGTAADGSYAGVGCTDWTSTTSTTRSGVATSLGSTWTDTGSAVSCSTAARFYCVQTGGSGFAPLTPPPAPPDAVYIWTSAIAQNGAYTLPTMDRVCDDEAAMAGLPDGDYVALVSSSGTVAQPAFPRAMTYGTLVRPDGWIVGPHSSTSSVLLNNVGFSEGWSVQYNGTLLASAPTWTGMTTSANTVSTSTCTAWSSTGGGSTGGGGDGTSVSSTWSGSGASSCTSLRRWTCILGGSGF